MRKLYTFSFEPEHIDAPTLREELGAALRSSRDNAISDVFVLRNGRLPPPEVTVEGAGRAFALVSESSESDYEFRADLKYYDEFKLDAEKKEGVFIGEIALGSAANQGSENLLVEVRCSRSESKRFDTVDRQWLEIAPDAKNADAVSEVGPAISDKEKGDVVGGEISSAISGNEMDESAVAADDLADEKECKSVEAAPKPETNNLKPPPEAVYSSREEATAAMNRFAREHGYGLINHRSWGDGNKKARRALFLCDRHGLHDTRYAPGPGAIRRPNVSTRKCNCPMKIDIRGFLAKPSLFTFSD